MSQREWADYGRQEGFSIETSLFRQNGFRPWISVGCLFYRVNPTRAGSIKGVRGISVRLTDRQCDLEGNYRLSALET